MQDNNPKARLLEKLAGEFRDREEAEWEGEWVGEPGTMFAGYCQDVSRRLAAFLAGRGHPAERMGGYYRDIPQAYFDRAGAEYEDGTWKHWWVEASGLIIDITADQFHPEDPEDWRVVVTPRGDPAYGRASGPE